MLNASRLLLPGGGGVAPITTLSYIAEAVSTTASVSAPASIEPGDLLIMIDGAEGSASDPTVVVPTNFTQIGSTNESGTTNMRMVVSYKIADGSEDSASITGMDGSLSDNKILWQFRGSGPITGFTVSTPVTQAVLGNPAQQTIAASGGVAPVLGIATFFNNNAGASINPRTTSITPTRIGTSSAHLYGHAYIQDSSPADYTFDMDDEGDGNFLFGFYIHSFLP